MKKIYVWAETNRSGSCVGTYIEVPDDATTEQIEDEAMEAAAELYNFGWEEVKT